MKQADAVFIFTSLTDPKFDGMTGFRYGIKRTDGYTVMDWAPAPDMESLRALIMDKNPGLEPENLIIEESRNWKHLRRSLNNE